ncbi:hypothetical protein GTY84_29750 [Streptomyces sp. SID8352]|nr:hypothetical protein [Streptomyces sp. SID8352]
MTIDAMWCREVHPNPGLVMPRAHFPYDETDGRPYGGRLLGEALHAGLAASANHVQRGTYGLVTVQLRCESPRLMTGDRCLDRLTFMKLTERAPRFVRHGGIIPLDPPLIPTLIPSVVEHIVERTQVGHSGTAVTEEVHRKRIRPVIQTGAVVMDGIFGADPHWS